MGLHELGLIFVIQYNGTLAVSLHMPCSTIISGALGAPGSVYKRG